MYLSFKHHTGKILSSPSGAEQGIRVKYKYTLDRSRNLRVPHFVDKNSDDFDRISWFLPSAWISEFQSETRRRLYEYCDRLSPIPENTKPEDIAHEFMKHYELGDFYIRPETLSVTIGDNKFDIFIASLGIDFKFRDLYLKYLGELREFGYISQSELRFYTRFVLNKNT